MIPISNDFKTAMKQPVKELQAYITSGDISLKSEDDLISFKISCDSGLCKTAMRKLEAKYLGEHNLLGQTVHVGYGVKLPSGVFDYLDYGSFLITEITTIKDTGVTTILGYDKMVNSMKNYNKLDVEYPVRLIDYTRLLCEACNLELGNSIFGNNIKIAESEATDYHYLVNALDTKPKDFKIYGNTIVKSEPSIDTPAEIETVGSNINLLSPNKFNNISSCSINEKEHLVINTTANTSNINLVVYNNIGLLENTYTISATLISGTYNGKNVVIRNNSGTSIGEFSLASGKGSITVTGNIKDIVLWNVQNTTNCELAIKIEKGSTATPYSPYGMGGIEVKASNANLLPNLRPTTQTINGVTLTNNGDGTYYLDGTPTAYLQFVDSDAFILKKGNYTLYGNVNIQLRSKDGLTTYVSTNTNRSKSFTFEKDTEVRFRQIVYATEIYSNKLIKPMLISGTNQIDFIEHQSQSLPIYLDREYCKIGDFQDYIYIKDGKWYKHKEILKIILDENSPITYQGTNTSGLYRYLIYVADNYGKNVKKCDLSNSKAYSNRLSLLGNDLTYACQQGFTVNNNIIYIYTDGKPLADFKTYLTDKPMIFYIPLETPEEEELVDFNINLYRGINNITIDSNMETDTSITYYQGDSNYNTMNDYPVSRELWENIEGITYRDILVQIAQATGTTCLVSNDDKLYFKELSDTGENLTYDNMFKLKLEPKYGEINSLVLSRTPAEDNVYRRDEESIQVNGLTEFKIENNEIIDKDRDLAMTPIYNILKGTNYYPFETTTEGLGWYEIGDKLDIINDTGDVFNTALFNYSINIDGSIKETLKTVAETKTQTQYQYATTLAKRIKNTEIILNKQDQYIEQLVTDMYEEGGVVNNTFTQVRQDITNIINSVQNSGGSNIIKNSVMFAYDSDKNPNGWDISGDGTLVMDSNTESLTAGCLSGHSFTLENKKAVQRVNVSNDSYYTFTTRIKKSKTGSCYVKLYNSNENYTIELSSGEEAFYKEFEIKALLPRDSYYDIEFYGSADSDATFTDNMLAIGEYKSKWTQANGEIMNTQVNVNIDGVLVKSSVYLGDYTVMSPLEFAGYSNINGSIVRVFSLNKDVTEVDKLLARHEMKMVPMKIVPVTSGEIQGWAFVPST